jgi:hypothetical protein
MLPAHHQARVHDHSVMPETLGVNKYMLQMPMPMLM